MRTIIFTKDFATRKEGEKWACDSMLARDLVDRGVAKFYDASKPKPKTTGKRTRNKKEDS